MENANNSFQQQNGNISRSDAEQILGINLSSGSPVNNQQYTAVQKSHHPKRSLVLVGAGVLAFALVCAGVFMHTNYQARDNEGNTISDLEAKIAALEPTIAELSSKESSLFKETGFSSEFFKAADDAAQVKSEKVKYESAIEELQTQTDNKTFISTGAIWFAIAGLVVIAVGITVFLRL